MKSCRRQAEFHGAKFCVDREPSNHCSYREMEGVIYKGKMYYGCDDNKLRNDHTIELPYEPEND